MFVKITSSYNHKYVQIVESFREEGSKYPKHKILAGLGRLEDIENNPDFIRFVAKLAKIAKANLIDVDSISEANIVNWGYVVYKKIWSSFGIDEVLKSTTKDKKTKFCLSESTFLMVITHLLRPKSKLATFCEQHQFALINPVELNSIYRSLDLLGENKDLIEKNIYENRIKNSDKPIDVVLYDVTTFHFESVKADSLRDFGFSKNAKFNEVQVVLGLLVDTDGSPIGYDLFAGNTFEGKTLETALEKLEKNFNIQKIIIVADKGINSKLNLKKITDKGYSYVFASRIKTMDKKTKEEIFQKDYKALNNDSSDEVISYKTIDRTNKFKVDGVYHEINEKLLITYSSKRAKKDSTDREKLIEKAKNLLAYEGKIAASNKRGGKKYLKNIAKDDWILDEEAAKKDELFDGYYGIATDKKGMKVEDMLSAYHTLWRIEESFRIMKSTLEVRPVFHWTEKRIKGHFVMCFLAFLLERALELKLKDLEEASVEKIKKAINSLNFSEVKFGGEKHYIKTKPTKLAAQILKKLKIKTPSKNLINATDFNLYISQGEKIM